MTYKKALVLTILLLVGYVAHAQYCVVVGSARTFNVPEVDGHVFLWEVLQDGIVIPLDKDDNNSFTVGDGDILTVGSIDPSQANNKTLAVTFKWPKQGVYTIRLTETNAFSCARVNLMTVNVIDSPLSFNLSQTHHYDVIASQEDGNRIIELPISFENIDDSNSWAQDYYNRHDVGDSDNSYTVVLNVTYLSEKETRTTTNVVKKVCNEQSLVFDCQSDFDFKYEETDQDDLDRYIEFDILSVKDKYGAELSNRVNGNNKFVFGVYKKVPVTKINFK